MIKIVLFALIASSLSMVVMAQQVFLGCCLDPNGVDLPYKAYYGRANTNSDCASFCAEMGYAYAGTQNGDQCWCGNKFCTYGKLEDPTTNSCNKPCAGNANEMCGAFGINSVYKTPPRYLGCYVDVASNRDLTYRGANTVSPTSCSAECTGLGYKFSGLQNANECWCGNTYGKIGIASASDCKQCSGSTNMCGAPNRNSVYLNWA